MGEISEMMTNGDLCCECGTALHEDCSIGIPVRCNSCHGDKLYIPKEGIHSEKSVLKRRGDPLTMLEVYVEYNLVVELASNRSLLHKRKDLVNFIARLTLALVEDEEDNEEVGTSESGS